jgi:hypothetical protein
LGAEPHYFFLDEKVTKNQVSKEASLRSWPLPGKFNRITGCNIFAPLRSLLPHASAKSCYAFPARKANLFCCISPEAFLLTLCTTLRFC